MTTLIVIAKEPLPGRVKTRLQAEFTAAEAAALADGPVGHDSDAFARRQVVSDPVIRHNAG